MTRLNYRRFESNPTPEYVALSKNIRGLMDKSGLDAVQRAFAEATTEETMKAFGNALGVTRSQGVACVQRILGKPCTVNQGPSPCPGHPPGDDHPSVWNKDGKPFAYIFQPYSLGYTELQGLIEYCDAHGLQISFSGQGSWYFPSQTLLVVLTRKDA